jgi:putative PIN family toxin of toxin-antitoxin system
MRTIRVVLDTNVVVSAHLNDEGYERSVLDLALSGKLRMFVSEAILGEYASVLRRPKFRLKPRSVSDSLLLLRAAARVVAPHRQQTSFPQAVAADFDRERAGVAGVDNSGDVVMGGRRIIALLS